MREFFAIDQPIGLRVGTDQGCGQQHGNLASYAWKTASSFGASERRQCPGVVVFGARGTLLQKLRFFGFQVADSLVRHKTVARTLSIRSAEAPSPVFVRHATTPSGRTST